MRRHIAPAIHRAQQDAGRHIALQTGLQKVDLGADGAGSGREQAAVMVASVALATDGQWYAVPGPLLRGAARGHEASRPG
jgi:hypothetical protein